MKNTLKEIEGTEDILKLVTDNGELTVTTDDNDSVTLAEADSENEPTKFESVEDLFTELEDKFELELTEDDKEEIKEKFKALKKESEEEKLDEEDEEEKELDESEDEEEKLDEEDEEEKKLDESEDEEEFKLAEIVDDELPDELKEKINLAFNTIIKEKTKKIKKEAEEKAEEEVKKELKESIAILEKAVEVYLEGAARKYINENKIAITEGLRTKYFENFFGQLKTLFKENYINFPAKDESLVEALTKEKALLESRCEALLVEAKEASDAKTKVLREKEIATLAADLYLTDSERFLSASEDLLNENVDDETFNKKLKVISELFKPKSTERKNFLAEKQKVIQKDASSLKEEATKTIHSDVKLLLENFK